MKNSNYLLDELDNIDIFKDINIRLENNKYFIDVVEYPVIQKIYTLLMRDLKMKS